MVRVSAPIPTAQTLVPVQTELALWFGRNARDLPWRRSGTSAWGVLLSEVMSQQTPVARVAPLWQRWMDRWPTPADVAGAPRAQILKEWANLGYPRRALRLHECAGVITAQYGGEVPSTVEELRALPGIGEYTAAAVVAFAFGRRSTVVDTNVRRVLARVVEGKALPSPSYSAVERRLAQSLVPHGDDEAALWAVSSMEFGALICTARAPQCGLCPVQKHCAWRLAGYPVDEHADARRPQRFEGTDRQVRGKVMRYLRDNGFAQRRELDGVWPDAAQLESCIVSLIVDGLIENDGDVLHLPDAPPPPVRGVVTSPVVH